MPHRYKKLVKSFGDVSENLRDLSVQIMRIEQYADDWRTRTPQSGQGFPKATKEFRTISAALGRLTKWVKRSKNPGEDPPNAADPPVWPPN